MNCSLPPAPIPRSGPCQPPIADCNHPQGLPELANHPYRNSPTASEDAFVNRYTKLGGRRRKRGSRRRSRAATNRRRRTAATKRAPKSTRRITRHRKHHGGVGFRLDLSACPDGGIAHPVQYETKVGGGFRNRKNNRVVKMKSIHRQKRYHIGKRRMRSFKRIGGGNLGEYQKILKVNPLYQTMDDEMKALFTAEENIEHLKDILGNEDVCVNVFYKDRDQEYKTPVMTVNVKKYDTFLLLKTSIARKLLYMFRASIGNRLKNHVKDQQYAAETAAEIAAETAAQTAAETAAQTTEQTTKTQLEQLKQLCRKDTNWQSNWCQAYNVYDNEQVPPISLKGLKLIQGGLTIDQIDDTTTKCVWEIFPMMSSPQINIQLRDYLLLHVQVPEVSQILQECTADNANTIDTIYKLMQRKGLMTKDDLNTHIHNDYKGNIDDFVNTLGLSTSSATHVKEQIMSKEETTNRFDYFLIEKTTELSDVIDQLKLLFNIFGEDTPTMCLCLEKDSQQISSMDGLLAAASSNRFIFKQRRRSLLDKITGSISSAVSRSTSANTKNDAPRKKSSLRSQSTSTDQSEWLGGDAEDSFTE